MGFLLFLLVMAIAFTWLVVRSIRAGYGKGLFWLAWFLLGLSVILGIQTPAPPEIRFLVQAWAYSVVLLPVWWAIRALRRASRRS
jgi:hypothetical protein